MTEADASLEDQFRTWVQSRPDVQNLDDLHALSQTKHADYLFRDRIVVEIKGLHAHPDAKIDAIYREMERRPEVRRLRSPHTIMDVIALLPDGKVIERRLFRAISGSVKTAYRKAKRQISATISRMPGAQVGVIAFFNESVGRIRPDDISVIVSRFIDKDVRQGCPLVEHIGVVVVVSNTHRVVTGDGVDTRVMATFVGPLCLEDVETELEIQELFTDWGAATTTEPMEFAIGGAPIPMVRS